MLLIGEGEPSDLNGFVVQRSNAFDHQFRDYEKESGRRDTVEEFYRTNHINQTFDFAKKKKEEYGKLQMAELSLWECCELLNQYVDESDPDLDEPQIEHVLQTAEAIRRDYPDEDWLHLTALIHDLGKVLLHPSFGGEPQWSVVGDTFPLGCAFDKSIVHHQHFKDNPDFHNPAFTPSWESTPKTVDLRMSPCHGAMTNICTRANQLYPGDRTPS